jgi:hypothetical protein
MSTLTINSDMSLQSVLGELREMYRKHKYLRLSVKEGKARSLDQNAISHAWYEQLAREMKEDDALGWKSYCKLHHGVPILRAEDEEFRNFYDSSIKGMAYEMKLAAMKYLPVTSLMTKPQLSKYLEAVRDDFARRGVRLEFPEAA